MARFIHFKAVEIDCSFYGTEEKEGAHSMDYENPELNIVIFFCQQLDPNQDVNRRALEKELGSMIKFFPLPCSGRIEPLHLLRALESGADKVYLLTCPDGACRYQQGNLRARRRLTYTKGLIKEIGLEPERLEHVITPQPLPKRIDKMVRGLLEGSVSLGPSPLRQIKNKLVEEAGLLTRPSF